MNMNRLGIVQGRLLPPVNGKIQAFPGENWRDEFALCREVGLNCMEWIFEYENAEKNPICSNAGIGEMEKYSRNYSVRINSVLADYFMVNKLFGDNIEEVNKSVDTLCFLISQCSKCNIPIIEIPLVDSSALESETDKRQIVNNLRVPLEHASKCGISIGLETSLEPKEFRKLILSFKSFDVKVNYDMGNSASLGYDSKEEIDLLGEFIINVHIKDREKNGSTLPLGEGNADFNSVFSALENINYSGDYMLQAARQDLTLLDERKDIIETISSYINFVKPFLGGLK